MEQNKKIKLQIVVHANSKSPKTEYGSDGVLHIYIKEPAIEGKANRAVVDKLSELYKTPKSSITLIHGVKSKNKLFVIDL